MEAVSALPILCEGNPPVAGEFLLQRTSNAKVVIFFGVGDKYKHFDNGQNKLLNNQSCYLWSKAPWRSGDAS